MVLDNGDYWEPESFQLEFVEDLFSDVPVHWLVVPEGNGKTTLLSGVALYWADYTPEAAVVMAASSRDQCGLLLSQGIGFVRRSPGFDKRFRVFEGYRRIDALRTHGEIQVFAADERTGDGVLPDLALCDELHRHRTLNLYRTWLGKLDKRDGTLAVISTAGEPGGEFETTRARLRTEAPDVTVKGRHVRAASPEAVLHDFALRPDDNADDMKLVKEANPFSGVTVAKLKRKRKNPSMTPGHWLRFVCNRATRTEAAAVGEAEWQDHLLSLKPARLKGVECDCGLDLGWKMDTTAIAPLFDLRQVDRVTEKGYLLGEPVVLTPPRDGNSLDPDLVMGAFEDIHAVTPIRRVVMDPSAGGEQLAFWLERDLGVDVVTYSQKPEPMALAAARFMEKLREDLLWHLGDPVLTRHVLNAVARDLRDGRFRFDRPVRSRSAPDAPQREIDALIAAAIVLSVAVSEASTPKIDLADYRIGVL